ncbi:MAG: response regulator, partial [Thermosynechococcaceae cyanobacterium]
MADIQLILVEADQPTRVALRTALRSQDGIEVASEATNGETGLVLLESIDVDVAVVDAHLPDMDLGTFVRQMRTVQAESFVTPSKLLILVNPDQDLELISLVATGAEAYCSK